MFDTLRRAFKIKDLRRRIGYTFLMLIVIRLGSELPTPGVNPSYIKEFFAHTMAKRLIYLTLSPVDLLSRCPYLL